MKPNKQILFTLIIIAVTVALMAFVIASSSKLIDTPTETNSSGIEEMINSKKIIIYYGVTCPYCKEVDSWIDENQAKDYLEIVHKEVSLNKQNSNELTKVATYCGLKTNNIGVPFMFAEGECYTGKLEIIEYLEDQLNSATEAETTDKTIEIIQEKVEDEEN